MKLRPIPISLVAILAFLSLSLLNSCQKEDSRNGSEEEQEKEASMASNEANVEAEETFNTLFDDVIGANDDVGINGAGVFYGRVDTLTPVPRCFTVTISHPNGTPFPTVIVVDFGTTGCTGPDGRTRRGKIITEYTARLINPGAVATTNFVDYYVNDVHVQGKLKISNIGSTNTTPIVRKFKVEVIDGKLTKPNGNYVKWNSTKTITQVYGMATNIPHDDVFEITGGAQGQVLRGNLLVAWNSEIISPLIKRFTCRYIVRGKIRTARLNAATNSPWIAVLDFGNGVCDNLATVTINGVTYQITLP